VKSTSTERCHAWLATGYTYMVAGMTGKSDHSVRWRAEWIGLKHPTDTNVRGCTLLSFQRPLRPQRQRDPPSFAHGMAPGQSRRDEQYSAAGALCLMAPAGGLRACSGTGAQAPKAALADLQDPAFKGSRLEIQRARRNWLAV
jgi:hypothetical protein